MPSTNSALGLRNDRLETGISVTCPDAGPSWSRNFPKTRLLRRVRGITFWIARYSATCEESSTSKGWRGNRDQECADNYPNVTTKKASVSATTARSPRKARPEVNNPTGSKLQRLPCRSDRRCRRRSYNHRQSHLWQGSTSQGKRPRRCQSRFQMPQTCP